MSVVSVDSQFRIGLQKVLARLRDAESFSIVQADLGDDDPQIRAGAIRLIGELELKEFLPNIMDRLQKLYGKDQPPEEIPFTLAVLNALEKIGDQAVAEELARRFEQLADKLKPASLNVIAAHGKASGEIDGFFQGLMRPDTPYPRMRAHAVELYSTIVPGHPNAKAMLAVVRQHLKDADQAVALSAAIALTRLLGERVFELPEWEDLPVDVQCEILQAAPAVPSVILENCMKSEYLPVQAASVSRVLGATTPPQAIRDVLRLYSAERGEECVVGDVLMTSLGRWYATPQGRLVLVQGIAYYLRRQTSVLEKFLPTPGTIVGDMDRLLARLRHAMLRSGSDAISAALFKVLNGKGSPQMVLLEVDKRMAAFPRERELRAIVEEMMDVTDERIRKRIAAEVKQIPAGAFIPLKRFMKILPPLRESSLITTLRIIKELSKVHMDEELEWMAVIHLAGCGEAASLTMVCEAVLKSVPAGGGPQSSASSGRSPTDLSTWVRSLSMDTTNAKVRSTLLTLVQRSAHPETFRAAVELLTSKVDAEVSNLLMLRLQTLKGAMRFIAIQAIGRMGDRVHLPVFLSELRAKEEDRKLAGLLGLEKLLDANPDLPPDTVSGPLYEMKSHPSAFVRASAIGLLVRLKDSNRVDLVSEMIGADGTLPVGAYRLVHDLVGGEMDDDARSKLFQALLTRIGRMSEDEEAVCDAIKAVLGDSSFASLLRPTRQRADAVEDLKDLLRHRGTSQAATDFKISKSIQRRAITFLDITGFTPRAARMTAIELGFFLVQVEDEIMTFITNHQGILVKRLGDGFLVSFPGVTQAVTSSIEMLHYLAKKNQLLQEEDRVRLRSGIHVGDVLVDRDDVFGDTVNIAARVEALSKPMCICFTEDVFRELPIRNDAIECLGPTKLKGKDEAITLYRIRLDVIYEAQTEAIQKIMATPDWLPKIRRFEQQLEDRYQGLKEKIEQAKHMVDHGDYVHAESLVEEIENQML